MNEPNNFSPVSYATLFSINPSEIIKVFSLSCASTKKLQIEYYINDEIITKYEYARLNALTHDVVFVSFW